MKKQAEITQRTKKNFIDAFWLLLKNNSPEKITIGLLAKTAGYNRSTFYEYFSDINDIMQAAEQELIDMLQNMMCVRYPEGVKDVSDSDLIRTAVEYFDILDDKLVILIGENGDPSFYEKFHYEMYPFISKMTGLTNDKYSSYISVYMSSVLISLIREWIKKEKEISKEELIELIFNLVGRGLIGIHETKTVSGEDNQK